MVDDSILDTMRKIELYLAAHPDAGDTLEGIHYSWLQSQEAPEITQAALELLQETDVVQCISYGRGTSIWRRAKRDVQ